MIRENKEIRTALLAGAPSTPEDLGPVDRETLFFVESELVEDFIEGSLSEEDSERFRTNYLVTEERRDLLNEVRLLKRFSSGSIAFNAEEFEEEISSNDPPKLWTRTVFAAAALIVLLLLVWFIVARLL